MKAMEKIFLGFVVFVAIAMISFNATAAVGPFGKTPLLYKYKLNKTWSFNSTCMQNAIETRDSAIITAFEKFSNDIQNALKVRKDSLKAAWEINDPVARKTAIRKAWENFKVSWKKAHLDLKNARKNAWNNYKLYVKNTCKIINTEDPSENVDQLIQI
ncbi:MAG: hypothetical protein QW802_01175 [Candidatus Altiarchaeota archaeon]